MLPLSLLKTSQGHSMVALNKQCFWRMENEEDSVNKHKIIDVRARNIKGFDLDLFEEAGIRGSRHEIGKNLLKLL
ncbi:hypothetical protein Tco_1273005 [Tanacetum coccineum]